MRTPWLRIDEPLPAHAACAVVSTLIPYGSFVAATARGAVNVVGWENFPLAAYLILRAQHWLLIALAAFVVAAPVVAGATWLGARLGAETWLYYVALGGSSATALAFALAGPPGPAEFEIVMAVWRIVPAAGLVWGAAWWFLHRRWKAQPRDSD